MLLTQILLLSLVISFIACFLTRRNKFILTIFEQVLICVGPIILTALSLFISVAKNGGTIKYMVHGWPHFFYTHHLEDIIDKTVIDKWYFVPGSLFSYPVANYVFYLSLIFLVIVLMRVFKKHRSTRVHHVGNHKKHNH